VSLSRWFAPTKRITPRPFVPLVSTELNAFEFTTTDDATMIQQFRAGTAAFEGLHPDVQFAVLVGGVFLFFGIHNYLQEAIMHVDGFRFGVMLGYFEVLGVAICSFLEREYVVQERGRKAPLSAYPFLTACLMGSSALSNISLNYINFPTKVVFRSCKLIPTMLVAYVLHKKIFTATEYACATAACLGLVLFAAADWETSPSFHPVGLALVSLSVCADAVLPNAQEGLFKLGSSRLEVTLYTNVLTLGVMTISTVLSGDLIGSLQQIMTNRLLATYFAIYTFIAYIAISFHMNVVKRHGGVAAVFIATGRKAMTLIVSFVLFPKGFTWLYPIGSVLVLGGLTIASLAKIWSMPSQQGKSKSQDFERHDSENGMNGHSKSPHPDETETRSLLHRHPSPMVPLDLGTRGNG
jgi:solute carrier family 35 (adenosine 3'-phospho 5'-phosphosulfate transporter), member B3